jgi:hypothetical protein
MYLSFDEDLTPLRGRAEFRRLAAGKE